MGRRHRRALCVSVVAVVRVSEVGIGIRTGLLIDEILRNGAENAPRHFTFVGGSARREDVNPRPFVHVVGGNAHAVGGAHGHNLVV